MTPDIRNRGDEATSPLTSAEQPRAVPETPVAQRWRPHQLRGRRPVLVATIITALVSGLQAVDPALHSLALPKAAAELGFDPASVTFIRSLSTVVLSACLLGVGLFGDRFGRRKAMILGVALMAVAALLSASASSEFMLGAGRVLMGIGTAISFSMCLAMVPTLYPKSELPKVFGMFFAIGGLVVVTTTSTSGALQSAFGWRASYLTTAVLCIVLGLLAWLLLPENRASVVRRFDTLGVVLAAIGLVALVFSLGRATTLGWGDASVLIGFAISAIALATFVWWERRVHEPGFPVSLFKVPAFAAACLTGVLFNWADASLLGQVPALALPADVPAAVVSVLVAGMYLGMIFGAPSSGFVQRRFGLSNRVMFTSGLLLCAASLAMQVLVTDPTHLLFPGLGLFLVGFAVMWMQNPQSAVILGSAPADQVGAVGAIKPAVGQFGFGLGFAVAAPIASIFGDGSGHLTAHSYGMGMFVQSWVFVIAAVAIFCILAPRRRAGANLVETETAKRS